jgi:ligand-binding sensor domain-containing protein
VLSLAVLGSLVFAGTDAGICRSSDNGASWNAIDSGMPDQPLIHSCAVFGSQVFAGTHSHGVFLSKDSGATWTAVDSGMPAATSVYSLTVSGGRVVAGTWGAGIFLLPGSQFQWIASNAGLSGSVTSGYVLSLASSGTNVCAGIGSGAYVSADGGVHWAGSNPSQIQSDVNGLAATGNDVFAATYSSGVFHSTDNGITLTAISEGLPLTNSQGLCVAVKGPYVFLGSGNTGVWRRPLSEVSPGGVRNEFRTKAKTGELSFGSDHVLRYELGSESFVSVTLHDVKGRVLCAVINRKQGAGRYSLPLNLENFPSGTYVLGFISDDFISQRRIVVCR